MGINFIDKCQPVRARAAIVNRLFNDAQQLGLMQQGTLSTPTSKCSGSLKSPRPFDAVNAYVCTSDIQSISIPKNTLSLYGDGAAGNFNAIRPYLFGQAFPDIPSSDLTDANIYNSIVGLLTPVTVSEYMKQKGYSRITRGYSTLYYGRDDEAVIVDSTFTPLNETEMFGDYIVPVIEWFYTDSNGERQKITDILFVYYLFTATAAVTTEYTQRHLFGGTYHEYVHKTENFTNSGGVGYFAFCPPYVHNIAKGFPQHLVSTPFMRSGVAYSEYSTPNADGRKICVSKHSAPYVSLIADTTQITSDRFIYPIYRIDVDGISSPIGINVGTNTYGGTATFPAYKDIQSIIDIFGDCGLTVTTDLDEAMNPPETDDGVINPDNPSEPLPFFPDNDSDDTLIEQAYITPSTFAQSCVYNPLTTRDFLRWICDNTVDVKNWSRLFANPVDVITGINLYNLDIPAHDSAHTQLRSETNILGVTTSIPNYAILDGYNNIVDGGTLTLEAYYGNYADFTSMTYQIFIPFVGFTSLRPCDVVNKTLHLFYAVDFATGAAVAFLNSDNKLIYTSPCTVAGKIPLSTSDKNSQMINNTLSILGSVGGLLGGIASGNVGGGVGALLNGVGGLQMQTNYSNKGSLSAVNIYKLLPAFIERTRYDLFFPSDDQQYKGAKYQSAAGAPSTTFNTLINCANAGGFVQSDVVYITSGTATETEKAEIAALIKSGIYL